MTVHAIRRGELVNDRTLGTDTPTMVLGPCEHRAIGYYCSVHNQVCANVGNLAMHLDAATGCRIAVWCGACRVFREADQAQMDALAAEASAP